ncbi:nucleoside deaminase [uncultured Chitinophaga sp.]|uniref:nucleoside deaminase n=1 Tax=uncultured Chitinophaga sp. TaxID=339340 RepID=UPI0025DF0F77|nr:nucleoside deaminase [uncultured Chitinophaga sp.]
MNDVQQTYEHYMQQCIALAETALQHGDPPVGALIVFDGQVIGTGIESGKSTNDITNHAEILAIKDAIKNGHQEKLHLAQMFTTHEPCLMCSYVIRHHRIPDIIYGVPVAHVGGATSSFGILTTEDVPRWGKKPTITVGIFAEACEVLNERFRAKL